jgi:hypothetical protein
MAMTKVGEVTVDSGGAASIEFTNIPQTGKDLLLLYSTRTNNTGTYSNAQYVTINNDTTSEYSRLYLRVISGTTVQTNAATNSSARNLEGSGNGATSNTFGNGQAYFSNYTSATNKSWSLDAVTENNATDGGIMTIQAGRYPTSSPITNLKIDYSGFSFLQYSTASLYIIS